MKSFTLGLLLLFLWLVISALLYLRMLVRSNCQGQGRLSAQMTRFANYMHESGDVCLVISLSLSLDRPSCFCIIMFVFSTHSLSTCFSLHT